MKKYKKLIVPNDSAWDRNWLWRNLHWRIRYFIIGVKNIFKWIPTLYKDKDWDSWYIYTILQKKNRVSKKRNYLRKSSHRN